MVPRNSPPSTLLLMLLMLLMPLPPENNLLKYAPAAVCTRGCFLCVPDPCGCLLQMLAGELDSIIHNGASVNLVRSYQSLKPVNVLGTQVRFPERRGGRGGCLRVGGGGGVYS